MEHAASVAKIFLTSDVVVTEIKEDQPAITGSPMDQSGNLYTYIGYCVSVLSVSCWSFPWILLCKVCMNEYLTDVLMGVCRIRLLRNLLSPFRSPPIAIFCDGWTE